MQSVYAPETMIDGLSALRAAFDEIQIEERKIFELVKPVTHILDQFFDPSRAGSTSALTFGSWARGTAVPSSSDYNIAYELPRRLTENILTLERGGAAAILALVDRLIKEKFPEAEKNSEIGSIVINLNQDVRVDLRPCIRNAVAEFAYPDGRRQGGWRIFDPHLCVESIRKLDAATRENFFFLCRAVRIWRDQQTVPLSGILIDTLAYRFIETSPYRRKPYQYQDCLFRDFLGYLSSLDPQQEWWYAPGSKEPVFRKGNFETKARESFQRVQQAMEFEAILQHRTAWKIWADVFGESYAII